MLLKIKLILISFLFLNFNFLYASKKIDLIFASSMPDITVEKNGTFSQLSTVLKDTKNQNLNTIFLFGGDSLGPSPMSSLDQGSHIIDLLNSLEPDVMSLDKQEFSYYEDEMSLRSYEAAFPIVLSNVSDKLTNDNLDGIKDYVIIKRNNIEIAVISVMNEEVIDEYNVRRIIVQDIEKSIREKSKKLKSLGVNMIILLPSDHFSVVDTLLDENIIDLSITKNVHFNLTKNNILPKNPRNILITKKDEYFKAQIDLSNSQINILNKEFISLKTYKKDPIIERRIQEYNNRLNLLLDEVIGEFKFEVDTRRVVVRSKENPFAELIADSAREYTSADIVIINGGTIRGDKVYKKGHKVTRKDISKELPYRNNIILLEVSGKQVIEALENGFSLVEKLKGRFPQVSGIKVEYNLKKEVGKRVEKVLFNGKNLNPKETYTLAVTDYLATGGDGYSMLANAKQLNYNNPVNRLITDILIDYIKDRKSINYTNENRLKLINE